MSEVKTGGSCHVNCGSAPVVYICCCFQFELFRSQPYQFVLYQRRAENGWLVTQVTSYISFQTQTVKHKKEADTDVFWRLSVLMLLYVHRGHKDC